MRIIQISYAINPTTSCYRLKHALEREGYNVKILTMHATTDIADEEGIIVLKEAFSFRLYKWLYYRARDIIIKLFYPKREPMIFNLGELGISYRHIKKYICEADIVHIHWALGMINYSNLKKILADSDRVIWTVHDCWPFTGGCHHDDGCERYQLKCGKCPQLNSKKEHDITKHVIEKKKRIFENSIVLVGPSQWMTKRISRSSVFSGNRVVTIPNALDVDRFKILDKNIIRDKYNITKYSKVLVVGAVDMTSPYKGYDNFVSIMEGISRCEGFENAVLLVFGQADNIADTYGNITVMKLGFINDEEKMAEVYNAADVFLLTSKNENLPTTVMESMACGTPVVAFDVGGVSDMISHGKDGYIAKVFDVDSFVAGINWCLENGSIISDHLHDKMKEYCSYPVIASKHLKLYKNI